MTLGRGAPDPGTTSDLRTVTGLRWWRDPRGRTRALLIGFGAVALAGMLITAVFNYLLAGDNRQLVVTMQQGVTDADRATLKQACGSLPGVTVVPDKGAQDRQYRFPVRFTIGGTSPAQEAALESCINGFPDLVRGVLSEGDR